MGIEKRKLLFDVGVNDSNYATDIVIDGVRSVCPYYRRWRDMIRRCYCSKHHEKFPTYKDCTVCYEWKVFSVFKEWMISKKWKDKELDKDIKILGCKVYSPSSCLFISSSLNKLLLKNPKTKGLYPTGVNFDKRCGGVFIASIKIKSKKTYLGSFSNPEDAEKCYKKRKNEEIARQASENPEIENYILQHLI